MKKRLQFIFDGAAVHRFHTRPGIKPDTDGRHCHGVAMLCELLTEGRASKQLIMAALTHDLAEQVASDVSAPTKRMLGIAAQLQDLEDKELDKYGLLYVPANADEMRVLRLADYLDGMLYCCSERALGNTNMTLIFDRWTDWTQASGLLTNDVEESVFDAVISIWEDVCNGGQEFDCFGQ